jgi:glycosyltransferase involved in cell wall biosynthesis
MRILTGIDVPFRPFGGSLLCCNDWYSNLPKGVEARFLTLTAPPGEPKWWNIQDVVMLDITKRRSVAEFPHYLAELQQAVQQQIEAFQPDIIHCQHLNYGLSRAFAELQTPVPKIGICHGTDVQAAVTNSFFRHNLTVICDAMDTLLFPNQTMANDFFAVYNKPHAYALNALGIPDSFYQAHRRPVRFLGQNLLRVLYAGRLLHWKGADIAVAALQHTNHPTHLTIIGNEDEAGYKTNMQQFARQHGLQHAVTFQAQLPREQLLAAFQNFDVIVFPSRRLEAFSLTVVEAQASGLPVVCGQGGGIVDTLGDGGLLLPETTPRALARALDHLYENPTLLQTMQAKGYHNAEKYRLSASQARLFALSQQCITATD